MKVKYKFYFEVELENLKDLEVQNLFENVAKNIQGTCPFDDDNWDYSISDYDCMEESEEE